MCDSPLERGVGVWHVIGLTPPCSRTLLPAPSQEGNFICINTTNALLITAA